MKIAINHTRFARAGGIEKYLFSLVERLLAEGHDVHLFVRRWEPMEHPRLHFHHVPALPLGEGMKVLTFAYASRWLLSREEFDVIHGFTRAFHQDVYTDGSGCSEDYQAFLRRASPWRRITTFRPLLAFATRHVERRRYRRRDPPRVLAMSERTRRRLIERHGLPPENTGVFHGAVDTREFDPRLRARLFADVRRELGTPPEASVALFLGNDYRRKGLKTTLEAMARLGSKDLWLWVAGRDRQAARYERRARQLGLAARFLGPRSDAARLMAASDIFVFPSRFDVFGNAGLEAMAAGLACVISARAGVSEIVDDGVDGLILSDPEDPDELRDRLLLLMDPGRRAALGVESRRKAEAFGLDEHVRRVLDVYQEVAATKRRPGRVEPGREWRPDGVRQ